MVPVKLFQIPTINDHMRRSHAKQVMSVNSRSGVVANAGMQVASFHIGGTIVSPTLPNKAPPANQIQKP